MKLGLLKDGDEFRMWDRGPLLHVVENKGETVLIQRGDYEITRQELPADHEIVTEKERDLDGDPSEQINEALKKSPLKSLREMRVAPTINPQHVMEALDDLLKGEE